MGQLQQDGVNDEDISQTVLANPLDKFNLAVRQLLPKLMADGMIGNDVKVGRCCTDPDFQETVYAELPEASTKLSPHLRSHSTS